MEKIQEMEQLIAQLDQAAKAYYQESREIMTNYEYDELYDRLCALEKATGITLSKSPTVKVGYEVLSDLPKEPHPTKMLSLDKTKEVEQLISWLGPQEGVLSWKLDGLTIVLTYRNGKLDKAVTRGNGEVGEVVTNNARVFMNLPLTIDFEGELILRGEAVISYADFEYINESITDESEKYKNPRNLCAGSVRQLNNEITAKRRVGFYAFALVSAEGMTFERRTDQMEWLAQKGFTVVEYRRATAETLAGDVEWFATNIESNPLPSDGLVLCYDSIAYGTALGQTAKFPKDSIAFKWRDELRETELIDIEWSPSRTGLINPVAVFAPVELEGTTVSRASVHNVSVMKELKLGMGDRIMVYKANMIIPQIAENLTGSDNIRVPKTCPVCGGNTAIHCENGIETLHCPNPLCQAKQIKGFTLFVSRNAMDIDGLSEMTLEKLIGRGIIRDFADLFHLENYREEIIAMDGFGEKSFTNLQNSIEKARQVTTAKFLYSLGIPNIGVANANLIAGHCQNRWETIGQLTREELISIDGIGEIMADGFVKFFQDEENQRSIADLLKEIKLDESYESSGATLAGITFVITGALEHYANREALKAEIEKAGGKVAGSVSAKTGYLINNDVTSASSKNKKARELGIPIIDEDTIREWLATGAAPEN